MLMPSTACSCCARGPDLVALFLPGVRYAGPTSPCCLHTRIGYGMHTVGAYQGRRKGRGQLVSHKAPWRMTRMSSTEMSRGKSIQRHGQGACAGCEQTQRRLSHLILGSGKFRKPEPLTKDLMLTKWLPFVYTEGCPKNGVEQLRSGPKVCFFCALAWSLNFLCGYRACVYNPIFLSTATHHETSWLGL